MVFVKILFEFDSKFCQINPNALKDNWSRLSEKPFLSFNVRLDDKFLPPIKERDMQNILMMLKLLPVSRISFEKSFNSLIVISEVLYPPF